MVHPDIVRSILSAIYYYAARKPLLRVITVHPYSCDLIHPRCVISPLINIYGCIKFNVVLCNIRHRTEILELKHVWVVLQNPQNQPNH